MLCAHPIPADDGFHACGQCLNCRINKRRQWTCRLLLEGLGTEAQGGEVSWVTLTYADANLPYSSRGGSQPLATVVPHDYQLAWKRLRKLIGSFRFFLVGEYGSRTQRPHYHALIFGPRIMAVEDGLKSIWEADFGHTRTRPWSQTEDGNTARDVCERRAAYCANYLTKAMTAGDSPGLEGRHPEFCRMSRRPGIGMVNKVLELHYTPGGSMLIAKTGDVRREIRIGGKKWPLSPTVRNWLRDQMGIPRTAADRLELFGPPEEIDRINPTSLDYERAKAQNEKGLRALRKKGSQL